MKTPVIREFEFKSTSLPKYLLDVIKRSSQKAEVKKVAIVGGLIRDEIIAQINKTNVEVFHDIDLIVEGSYSTFATAIQSELGKIRAKIIRDNTSYQTIEMLIDGMKIDIASAREEIYKKPAENPIVSLSTIKRDLDRRDFNINAIAVDLITYEITDPYKGRDSLVKKELRFIHSKSVLDDPTRIIRGARYAARLNFQLSPDSLIQIKSTIDNWPWSWKHNTTEDMPPPALSIRLRMELDLLFEEEKWSQALMFLQEWNAFLLLEQNLQNDSNWRRRIHWGIRLGIKPLIAFIAGASNPSAIAKRLQLSTKERNLIADSERFNRYITKLSASRDLSKCSPYQWCQIIEEGNFDKDAIGITIILGTPLWRFLLRWFLHWRLIKSPISAKELIEQGWQPGPSLGEELKRQREQILKKEKHNEL
tara:strand:- start:1565 stop:2827 length:1263 start_codon:yes stop_codon:yes gene_type:complete